ncbi:calcitonin receptor isoform X3 [Cuculus canorus]|nr:calcitonin receptor isoform X3 [Cuculus canorus]
MKTERKVSYNMSLLQDSTMKTTTHSCFLLVILLIKMVPTLSSTVNYTDPTLEPVVTENSIIRQKIIDSQFKCYERMNRAPPYKKKGLFCNRTWDGWLCWDDTPAGRITAQNCPDYFPDFDPTERASKYCDETGNWFRHPESNRTWSNYTLCNSFTSEKLKMAFILYYMAIVGHALSIASLLISLAIFFYFKSLSCQRITLHKNLFFSYVLNSMFTIAHLIAVVPNPGLVKRDPVSCKVLQFFHQYMLGCNYFWMLCEGIYLHTLIVVAVFAEEQRLHWYYLLGWGFPVVPASIHAVARAKYFNDNCWMSVDTHLLYIVHGPVMAALLVNFFFLLNIVRVLVTKLRDTHRAESNMYMKAVRATLILVPLLGIQFVIIPWRPENRLAGEIYDYIMHILMHYQGLLVATIFCFFNGEVQGALKRQWTQYKTQWGQRRREHCSTRSTSYTATSITEVPVYLYHHDSNNEQLNGRYVEDSELVALKSGETSA